MFKNLSERQIQIALFFPLDTNFKSMEAAGVISELFGHIFKADPNIISLPINAPVDIPKIMYNEAGIAQFNVGTQRADFFLHGDTVSQYNEICGGLKAFIDKLRLNVVRIGVIATFGFDDNDIKDFIVEFIKSDKFIDSRACDIGWLRQYTLSGILVNKWTRIVLSDELPEKRREILVDLNSTQDLSLDLSSTKLDDLLKEFYQTIKEDINNVI